MTSDDAPDPLAEREARLAAAEAAAIGGTAGDEHLDPAERPVLEGGGGVAEGFEQAEELLVEHATHGDGREAGVVIEDAGAPEPESARATAEDAEADALPSTSLEDGDEQARSTDG